MPRQLNDILTHLRSVIANPAISTTLIQTEDLAALCDEAERKQQSLETMAGEVLDRNQRIARLEAELERLQALLQTIVERPPEQRAAETKP